MDTPPNSLPSRRPRRRTSSSAQLLNRGCALPTSLLDALYATKITLLAAKLLQLLRRDVKTEDSDG